MRSFEGAFVEGRGGLILNTNGLPRCCRKQMRTTILMNSYYALDLSVFHCDVYCPTSCWKLSVECNKATRNINRKERNIKFMSYAMGVGSGMVATS
jgi:hypothetical protein